ncbi:hypothetical protein [Legionella sp. W05-934-2]|jgi:hypothetical protein|uniref:hypothetical protein n=1 Tax=Legionella sp. W05-934-2 TaxID=1198649 RepID=UPI0034627948
MPATNVEVKQVFSRRANQIHTAIASGTLKTQEDANELLRQSKSNIVFQNKSHALLTFREGFNQFFKSDYLALDAQIRILEGYAAKLPNRAQFNTDQLSRMENQKAEQALRTSVQNFKDSLVNIDDSSSFKVSAEALQQKLDDIVKTHCEDNVFTKDKLPLVVKEIADAIETSKPSFEAKAWHKVADIALLLLNALKTAVRGVGVSNQRFKLFSEEGMEANAVKQLMDTLKHDVDSLQPAAEEVVQP